MYLHYFAIILSLEKSLALYLKKKNNPKMSYIQESFVLKFSKNTTTIAINFSLDKNVGQLKCP